MTGRDPEIGRAIQGPVRVALLGVAALAILTWVVLALAHVHDRYNVNAVSGTFLALAERAREGTLYPPLFDGQSYGGTRTMPVPILLYAASMSAAAGDLLAPAKVVDFLSSAALMVLLWGVLVRLGAGTALSLALASTVVTSQVFLLAGTGIRPESLPTALQLGAVALIAFSPRRGAVVLAAVLCGVALFAKLSALWAAAAIVLWLLGRDRRRLLLFVAALAASIGVLFVVFNAVSDGRMLTNLTGLGGAGLSLIGVVKAPLKAIELLLHDAQATVVVLPLVLLGALFATRSARPTIFQLGLVAAAGILLVVMADVGSDYNHLLDVVVLVPIVAFEAARSVAGRLDDGRPVWLFLAAAVLVGSAAALAANAGSSIAAALQLPSASAASALDPEPLDRELGSAGTVLAEDPYVPLSLGQRPIVIDPFMLIRLAQRDPALVAPLLARVQSGEIDAIVLNEDLADAGAADRLTTLSFGRPFYDAIRASYRLCVVEGDSFLYVPDARPCPGSP